MSRQLGFIVRRLLLTIPMLFVMSIVVFLIIRLVPGDPVRTMLGFRATDANVAELRHRLGLDQSLLDQYLSWAGALLRGDLGKDIVSHASLAQLLAQRLPVTFELTGLSMLLAVLVGVPLGVRAATGGRWIRRLTEGFVVIGISVPDFWLGIVLVLIFAGTLMILPPSGYVPFATDPVGNLRYMVLPVLTLATGEAAYILRTTRGALGSVMSRPFITFLRAKGISPRRIVFGHALRNAGPSIVTVIGIQVGVLLGGAIIIETMFALPGVGRLVVTGINQRNYPTVQVGILAIATIFIVVSLITDLIVAWLDPRVADGAGT
ncbi:peptide/nickel transport system permease protein [Kaistia soli DSM 19436]|uniref:Peptide/nickel transport system permease protein n=1 Tax=Kaistia soli DSM 19436 TaxID=1122133 RepID=A0A1M5G832_9HYPH|nr:ABC transporter permease [Kaistia soli]SHF99980.1 peptide/nickel transport system permease protein [Kaistia soli DSM 19436]